MTVGQIRLMIAENSKLSTLLDDVRGELNQKGSQIDFLRERVAFLKAYSRSLLDRLAKYESITEDDKIITSWDHPSDDSSSLV